MNENTTINQSEVSTTQLITISKNRKAITTSLKVAEFFDKRHDNVMRDIEELKKRGLLNFEETLYVHPQNNQKYKMFEMDRTGFTLLAMGFTGEKALDFKIRYIQAFDAMEEKLMKAGSKEKISPPPVDVIPDETMMGNPNTWAVWSWCLSRAETSSGRKVRGGVPVDLKPGELIFTYDMIAVDLNLSRGVVRTSIEFLVKYGKAVVKSTNKFSVLTIPDWAERKGAVVPARKTETPNASWRGMTLPEPSLDRGRTNQVDAAAFEAYRKNTMDLIDHYKSMIAMYREEIAGYRSELAVYRGRQGGIG